MVEPQQVAFRAWSSDRRSAAPPAAHIARPRCCRSRCGRSRCRLVGAMIIGRVPFRPREVGDPWARAVMMAGAPSDARGRAAPCNRPPPRATPSSSRRRYRPRADRAEGLRRPFARDRLGDRARIPRQPPEGIPVRLVEGRAASSRGRGRYWRRRPCRSVYGPPADPSTTSATVVPGAFAIVSASSTSANSGPR